MKYSRIIEIPNISNMMPKTFIDNMSVAVLKKIGK
jgi:hypothetical protein